MKRLLPIILIMLAFKGFAQKLSLPLKDSLIVYENVIKLTDSTVKKDILFSDAKLWFANTFKNSKSVLQLEDKEAGRLVGHGVQELGFNKPILSYSVQIDVKNGRYRYRIYDLMMSSGAETWSVSHAYSLYLHDNARKYPFESEKAALKRYEAEFLFMTKFIDSIILSLNTNMIVKKSDDF